MGRALQVVLTPGTAKATPGYSAQEFSPVSVLRDMQGWPERFQAEEAQQHKALSWSLYGFEEVHSVQVEPQG